MMNKVRTEDLLKQFKLEVIAGEDGIHREINSDDISRPGFEMTGFFEYYPKERIQIVGKTEMNYFLNLTESDQRDRVEKLCTDITPGIIITNGMEVPEILITIANEIGVLILVSHGLTHRVFSRLIIY